jgi:hypothetical protein
LVASAKDGTGKFRVVEAGEGFHSFASTLAVESPTIIKHARRYELALRRNNRVFAL